MNTTVEIHVPDIGDFNDVPIIEIPVAVGDTVCVDDTLVVLESDKATLDVPSPRIGTIAELKVAEGDRVSKGSLVLLMEIAAAPEPAPPVAPQAAETARAAPDSGPAEPGAVSHPALLPPSVPVPMPVSALPAPGTDKGGKPSHASPSVRKLARTLGVAIDEVPATGRKNRITRDDVEAFVKTRLTTPPSKAGQGTALPDLPDWPNPDFAVFGPIERMPLPRIARISGPSLTRNAMLIPHVCNFDKADVSDLEDFRKRLNTEAGPEDARITMLAFAVKATVCALKAHPRFNASLDGDDIVLKHYWNIGVAADTPDGLVVPVIKEADRKGLREIAAEMASLAASARQGRLKRDDMQGATFTISSLGGVGGTGFTPIINAPEVAILGMTRAETQPVWNGSAFQPRLIQPLSLSWDHRVVDGVAAARFLRHVSEVMGDLRRLSV
ncbi:2-oxo acid dehydrogenase subunit E2 [Ponticoccus litoralis]|uniref:Dihydrolipoamide acetyltransferase component of pyruvate dehydrogenase complex n=1 Tax=Ponticoccus litoralis TaxID=422297 RepID=A0AAW9SVZ0_9RHOB